MLTPNQMGPMSHNECLCINPCHMLCGYARSSRKQQHTSDPQGGPPIPSDLEQRIKLFGRLSNDPKRILKGMSKVFEFLRDTFHRERIRKEEQLSRSMDLAVLDHV